MKTYTQAHTHTDRQMHRHIDIDSPGKRYKEPEDIHTDTQTHRHTDRQTDRCTDT